MHLLPKTELLNESLFLGLDHARTKITNWVDDYNQRRPHSALGYLTPAAYAAKTLHNVNMIAKSVYYDNLSGLHVDDAN